MNELALFAGAGGGILGGKLLGWRTVCAVEIDSYARSVLLARQRDGVLPRFPVWDDVRTFEGRGWRGCIDVVTGGFPCQDISSAGQGAGLDGERSGLWVEMARIIGEVRPEFAFVENAPMLTSRGLDRVLGDLASLGFDARWGVIGADDVGAPHRRDRIWIVAHSEAHGRGSRGARGLAPGGEREREQPLQTVADTNRKGLAQREGQPSHARQEQPTIERGDWWLVEPDVDRVADGVAYRVDRLRALGNGQVPLVAATAWRVLTANVGVQPRRQASAGTTG